jgi:hypothetical protein
MQAPPEIIAFSSFVLRAGAAALSGRRARVLAARPAQVDFIEIADLFALGSFCRSAKIGHGEGRGGAPLKSFDFPALFCSAGFRSIRSSDRQPSRRKNTIDLQWKIAANYNARP